MLKNPSNFPFLTRRPFDEVSRGFFAHLSYFSAFVLLCPFLGVKNGIKAILDLEFNSFYAILTFLTFILTVTDGEKRRLQDAFRRLAGASGLISRLTFIREIVGDGLPHPLAEQIYNLCNGLNINSVSNGSFNGSNHKGLNFREVLSYLVLITRGTHEEKVKFIFGLLASEAGMIDRSDMIRQIRDWENGYLPEAVALLFSDTDKVSFEDFVKWLDSNAECVSISR